MGPFGWILALLAVNGAILAALIVSATGNRQANRFLAAVILVITARSLVYVLGFAGAYDAAPWLTFLPLDASLALGPLLWLYVASITAGAPPMRWRWHLSPAAVQLIYFSVAFALPMERKWLWYAGAHLHIVEPLGLILILLSCAAYLIAAWRRQRAYQAWLDETFGNREQWRLTWLSAMLAAFAVTLLIASSAALWSIAEGGIDYFHRAPAIVATSILAYTLGLLGWRHAETAYPHLLASAMTEEDTVADLHGKSRELFQKWRTQVEASTWWQDELLTAPELARKLAVSERALSRGLREGGDLNFNQFINGFRVDAVSAAIAAGYRGDLLSLALDCGFNSKASFNRAFRAHTGYSPSQWRLAQNPPNSHTPNSEATARAN